MGSQERTGGRVRLEGSGKLLRIFLGESDRFGHRSLAEAIVVRAREEGLAGATVLRGIEGFGASSTLHTTRILRLSEDLPILIEIVDREDRIAAFLPVIDAMITEGLVTLENIEVCVYRGSERPAPADEGAPS
jgi:PII-like signaling protein